MTRLNWPFWIAVIGGAWRLLSAVYKDGKREGSKKGYGAGLRRRRGRR